MAIIVHAPAEIELGGTSIGTTKGDTVITCIRDYEPLKRPDSPHPFDYVKKNIVWEITVPVSAHTATNLARLFDIPEAEFTAKVYTNQSVQNLGTLQIVAGGITYEWTKVISVGNGGVAYSIEGITVIPLTLRAVLGSEGTTAKLNGNNLPAQFRYKIHPVKRYTEKQTYNGVQRYYAGAIYDVFVTWSCENMTWDEKTLFETLYYTDGEMSFQGIHGESMTVVFNELDAPEENDGYWSASGTFRVVLPPPSPS